jgi:hypothetical protein
MVLLPIQTGGLQDREMEPRNSQDPSKLAIGPLAADRPPMTSNSSQLQGHQLAGPRDSAYTVFCAGLQYLENKGKFIPIKCVHIFKLHQMTVAKFSQLQLIQRLLRSSL